MFVSCILTCSTNLRLWTCTHQQAITPGYKYISSVFLFHPYLQPEDTGDRSRPARTPLIVCYIASASHSVLCSQCLLSSHSVLCSQCLLSSHSVLCSQCLLSSHSVLCSQCLLSSHSVLCSQCLLSSHSVLCSQCLS